MKIITGKVIAKNMTKTATVLVERMVAHPAYKKRINLNKKYHVHDEMDSEVNDTVRFVECKPMSKTKKWKIIEVVGKKTPKVVKEEPKKEDTVEKAKKETKRKAKK